MRLLTLACITALTVQAATTTASATPIDCVCPFTFNAGDRVVALVDDPDTATGLPAGSLGTVICGTFTFDKILVSWDGWTSGHDNLGFCTCPASPPGGVSGSHWYVRCHEIAVFVPLVTNVTQSTTHETLQDALDNAVSGDAIEIAAGTLQEDGITFPAGLDVTITGAGPDQTFIDGGGGSDLDPILLMQDSGQSPATVISDLTLRNGVRSTYYGGGAVYLFEVSPIFRNVHFVDNVGGDDWDGGAHVNGAWSNLTFDRCTFAGGSNASSSFFIRNCYSAKLVNCLVVNGVTPSAIRVTESLNVDIVNCTVVAEGSTALAWSFYAGITVSNSVLVGGSSPVVFRSSLFQGAPDSDGNIDGVPTFVDASNGDYRLAAGSLGIDAADLDAYGAASLGITDLAGVDRTVDDASVADIGTGGFRFLDMGAFERQPAPLAPACPTDLDGTGDTGFADLVALLAAWGSCP